MISTKSVDYNFRVKAVEKEALRTCVVNLRPSWSNLLHIIALTNIIHRPIYSSVEINATLFQQFLS
jgi:hypothetical protein